MKQHIIKKNIQEKDNYVKVLSLQLISPSHEDKKKIY